MTVFEKIKEMSIEDMAYFIFGIIDETNKVNDAVLAENGITFSRVALATEIQIKNHIEYLNSEWDGEQK